MGSWGQKPHASRSSLPRTQLLAVIPYHVEAHTLERGGAMGSWGQTTRHTVVHCIHASCTSKRYRFVGTSFTQEFGMAVWRTTITFYSRYLFHGPYQNVNWLMGPYRWATSHCSSMKRRCVVIHVSVWWCKWWQLQTQLNLLFWSLSWTHHESTNSTSPPV